MAPVEILEAAVLGGMPEEPKDEPMVFIIEELSAPLVLGVMVMADARKGLLERPDRRVTASLPSCVAVPSRSSCTK